MNKLLIFSFSLSLIGILSLLFLSLILPIKQYNLEEINYNLLNKKVKVEGTIFNIRNYDNFQIISIKDSTSEIDITLNKIINISNNQKIIVIGTIQDYKQSLQIQADKILI